MNLLDFFRKSTGAGWVCRRELRLRLDNGKPIRLRPGQEIFIGDYRWQGEDLALALEALPGARQGWLMERPQNLAAALAR